MTGYRDLAVLLATSSSGLKHEYDEAIGDWHPEEPPATAMFGVFGLRIADDFRSTDVDTKRHLFSLIEQAMQSADEDLRTVVATGLIEALVNRAELTTGLWEEIVPFLGPRSRRHAEAWLAF